MKLLRVSLVFTCAALALAPAGRAQRQAVQASSAGDPLFVVSGPGGAVIRDGDRSVDLPLPAGATLSSVERQGDGWIVAGTAGDGERLELVLLAMSRGEVTRLPAPPGIAGPSLARPALLVERGVLAGLAWLEGAGYDTHAVRAAAWDGRGWSDAVTVSAADLDSQLALSGAVLSDGSWLLVWSAVDGHDDEIFWARRRPGGAWSARAQLNSGNEVPDIQPTAAPGPTGAFTAWSGFDGGDYRVRLARLDGGRWRDTGFTGPRGSITPRLTEGPAGPLLLYRRVLPDLWTLVELDGRGRPWRQASVAAATYDAPALSVGENEVVFRWPALEDGLEETAIAAGWAPWEGAVESGRETERVEPEPFSASDVRYRAFGDSITRGNGGPEHPFHTEAYWFDIEDEPDCNHGIPNGPNQCPIIGPACGPNANPYLIECGYNWRLETQLDLSFPTDVANDGYGGEGTQAGVTRINDVLDAGGDVVLVMEGSNDIHKGTRSIESITFDIGVMTDKATAKGFDTAIASVIKRKVPKAGNPTQALRNALLNLANQKNRAFVDAWSTPLTPPSFDHYWDGPDNIGHPDASGYDLLEPFFRNVILADPTLAAPAPTGPAGDVVGPEPTFTWNTAGNSRLYQLSVTGPAAPTTETWHDALAVCSGMTCSASQGALAEGGYTWKVRGKNLRGPGPFSAEQAFVLYNNAPAAAPATGEPIGACDPDCFDASPPAFPTFEFDATGNTNGYDLEVKNGGGSVIAGESFAAGSICAMGACQATLGTGLAAGSYTWRVRASNPVGKGPWSAQTAFSIHDSVPGVAAQLAPAGEIFDTTPAYRWNHVPGATAYRLAVSGGGAFTAPFSAGAVCVGAVCQTEPPTRVLDVGAHTWKVRADNPLGQGSYSADLAFEVLDCAAFPDSLELDGDDTGTQSVYRTCPDGITTKTGFKVLTGESVLLHGAGGVVFEAIEVESGATFSVRSEG